MKNKSGIIALLIKMGPKIIGALGKAAKALKVGKIGLAGASLASYAYLLSWEFAAIIMVSLFVHESGHIWAMKRCGIKTKGIYFIPFVGGAAVAEGEFSSRREEVFIAIMGPIWGFALAALSALAYYCTNNPLFAAAASWMAMMNLFNLLPINPLDGGRIMKSIAYSVHSSAGLIFLVFGMIASGFIAVKFGLYIFVLLLIVGGIELATEYRGRFQMTAMSGGETVFSAFSYAVMISILMCLMILMSHIPGAAIAMKVLVG